MPIVGGAWTAWNPSIGILVLVTGINQVAFECKRNYIEPYANGFEFYLIIMH